MDSLLLRSFPSVPSITTDFYSSRASWRKRNIQEHNLSRFQQLSLNHAPESIDKGSTCQEWNKKYVMKASFEGSFESESESQTFDKKSYLESVRNSLDAFYRFCRPYSFITSTLSTISVSLIVIEKLTDISPLFFSGVLKAIIASLLMHIYAVGVNQLADVEIDKINKPYLPLASGEFSYETGVIITTTFLILSFGFAWIVGSMPLFWTLFGLFLLSTTYSINLPLLRWKSSGVLAAISILAMQAIVPQIGFFYHMQIHVFKRPAAFPRPLIFAVIFMSLFFIVVALVKDIPDTEGDRKHGVYSFSVLLGPKPVFWTSVSLLGIAYGVAIYMGATSPYLWSRIITGLGHVILAAYLWHHVKSADVKSVTSMSSFYMLIWKLISAEYFLIPFVR